ncbi:MAG: metal-dependent transcriptional regulator [Ruminococcaceae bacterium]|nr:metal-dependent transcriptional regulator [Oscillospiraceae bacterium]
MAAVFESGEMYLETIYVLSKNKDLVRAIDVSEHLGYSKPSVSRALGILKKKKLVVVADSGAITLTKAGLNIASKIYERHIVLTEVLEKIGVSKKTATNDACRIEHVISDETFEKIKEYIK